MDGSGAVVVIPYIDHGDIGERILRKVVGSVKSGLPGTSVVVAHQNPIRRLVLIGAEVLPVGVDSSEYDKSALVNAAASSAASCYLWILEQDCVVDFGTVASGFGKTGVILPCSRRMDLGDSGTADFLENGRLPSTVISASNIDLRFYIIHKSVFDLVGGMHGGYEGAGLTDADLVCRASGHCETVIGDKVVHVLESGWRPKEPTVIQRGLFDRRCGGARLYPSLRRIGIQRPKLDVKAILTGLKPVETAEATGPVEAKVWKPPTPRIVRESSSGASRGGGAWKVAHVTAPALEYGGEGLRRREALALESMRRALEVSGGDVEIVLFTEGAENPHPGVFKTVRPVRTSRDIGDKRGMLYLSDIVAAAWEAAGPDGVVVYTNSDCSVTPDFYERVRSAGSGCVLLHRRNVYGDPSTLEELFAFKNDVFEVGVDGFVISRRGWSEFDAIIRDFFIGEPHWDTAVGGFLYKHGLASKDSDSLYHPFHQQNWSVENLSVAGRHNHEVYQEFVACGVADANLLQTLGSPKASVVVVHFGGDPVRDAAAAESARALSNQCFEGEIIIVELIGPGGRPAFDRLSSKFVHIVVEGGSGNMGVWQKEAMMNIGAKAACRDVVVFVDSDLKVSTCDWIERMARKVAADPERMVQGYRICEDSIYPDEYRFISYGAMLAGGVCGDAPNNPGLTWAVSKEVLRVNGYLNPFCLYGNGDSLFLAEYLGGRYPECLDWCVKEVPMMGGLVREGLFQCSIDYVDELVIHVNHGRPYSLRHYGSKNLMTAYFSKPMNELVRVDDKGLLEWVDPDCPEREMVAQRGRMIDKEAVDAICSGILRKRGR